MRWICYSLVRLMQWKHLWVCLWGCFQKDLIEDWRPTLSMGGAITWAEFLYWIKVEKPTDHQHSGSWLVTRSLTVLFHHFFASMDCTLELWPQINPSLNCFCFVTLMRKITNTADKDKCLGPKTDIRKRAWQLGYRVPCDFCHCTCCYKTLQPTGLRRAPAESRDKKPDRGHSVLNSV